MSKPGEMIIPWYEEIKREIKKRDEECKKKNGPDNEYKLPVNNVYKKYNTVAQFKRSNDLKCRYLKGVSMNTAKSDDNRYYKHIRNDIECNRVSGVWKNKDINRYNKYDDGVCWTSHEHASCGKYGNTELIRPSAVKKHIRNGTSNELIEDLKDKCNSDDRCKMKQLSKYSYDCVNKDVEENEKVSDIPENFPYDITKNDNQINNFLYDWYVNKKYTVPKTSELIGEGNRCNPGAKKDPIPIKEEDLSKLHHSEKLRIKLEREINERQNNFNRPTKKINKYTIDEIKELDPNVKENAVILENYIKENYNIDYFRIKPLVDTIRREYNSKNKGRIFNIFEASKVDDDDDVPLDADDGEYGVPTVPQSIVNVVMKNIANNPRTTNRGLLAWFSTGAGKTICAAGVMEAFWDTNKQIVFASSLDALASNPPINFYNAALDIFPRFQSEKYRGETREETIKNIENAFKVRNVRFLSFAKLSNRVKKTTEYKKNIKEYLGGAGKTKKNTKKLSADDDESETGNNKNNKASMKISDDNYIDLDNTILIIDEVHNLFRPEYNQAKEHKYLEDRLTDPRKHPNLKIAILTATPGDNIPDVVKLLNIVRDTRKPPIEIPNTSSTESVQKFREDIIGLISYFDMSGDHTKFPVVTDSKPILATMTETQFKRYVQAYKETPDSQKNFDKLAKDNKSNKYWQPVRKYANMLFNYENGMSLQEFGIKIPLLLGKIKDFPKEKHYVYSSFYENRGYGGQGVIAIGMEMMKKMGYTKLTVKEAMEYNKKSTLPPPGKRYILAISTELQKANPKGSVGDNLQELLKIYNHPENRDGKLIHVMLASNKFNEGIDLKAVRHIHFFEPLVTMASDMQTIGRAARNCSHAALDLEDWTVKIHRYMTNLPIEDEVNKLSTNKLDKDLSILEDQLVTSQNILDKANKKDKEVVSDLKANIKRLTSEIKAVNKQLKDVGKLNDKNVQNIEKKIFQESRDRMKDLLVIYHAMREAAIDCKVMEKFHEKSRNPVKCMETRKN